MSPIKEPQYFAHRPRFGQLPRLAQLHARPTTYLALFDGARPDQLTGEASTWHLYSKAAAAQHQGGQP